jgi:hypothetical protein
MINLKELKDNFNLIATFSLSDSKEFFGDLEGGQEVLDRISLVLTQTFDAIGALPFRQLIVKAKDKKVVVIYYRNKFFGLVANKDENVENILKYIYEKGSVLKTRVKAKETEVERAIVEKEKEPEKEPEKEKEKLEEKIEEPGKVEKKEIQKEELKEEAEEKLEEKIEEKEKIPEKVVEEEVKPEIVEPIKAEEKIEEPEKEEKVIVKKEVLSTKVLEYIEEIAGNYLGDFSLDIVSNVIEDSGIDKNNPTKDQVLGIAQSLKDAASLIIGPSKAKKLNQDILKKIEEV